MLYYSSLRSKIFGIFKNINFWANFITSYFLNLSFHKKLWENFIALWDTQRLSLDPDGKKKRLKRWLQKHPRLFSPVTFFFGLFLETNTWQVETHSVLPFHLYDIAHFRWGRGAVSLRVWIANDVFKIQLNLSNPTHVTTYIWTLSHRFVSVAMDFDISTVI